MFIILLIMLLASSLAQAETYERVDGKTIKVTHEVENVVKIEDIRSNREYIAQSCKDQLAEHDRIIDEAKKAGVE